MRTAPTVRLIIAHDQPIFRAGIVQICSRLPGIIVAGEAGRSADALGLCDRLRPDILLLDGALPGALSLIAQLRETCPSVGVVVLADRVDEHLLQRALQHGAVGYLLKHIDAFDLIQAIRSASGGLLTLAPEAAAVVLNSFDQPKHEPDQLSEREQCVLALLLNGLSNDTIADNLQVSRSTVKFHLRNIYSKLGVRSRAEALALVYGQHRPARGQASDAPTELHPRRALAVAI
jgi:NarL family two-component system response regulator LiaR